MRISDLLTVEIPIQETEDKTPEVEEETPETIEEPVEEEQERTCNGYGGRRGNRRICHF